VINVTDTLETAQRLFDTARHQSDLRRSVSTAYYALFYALGQECALLVFGAARASLQRRQILMRALGHEEMRAASRSFASARLPDMLAASRPADTPIDPRVVQIAKNLSNLYQARVNADYAHHLEITREDAAEALATATRSIASLPSLRRVPDFQVFLMALQHQRKLSGREP
jgi:uncharacterized protein (UPF0332 family)